MTASSTILIIDDEPDVRTLLTTRLRAQRYEVLEAADGPSAVALAKQAHPDAILLDIMMPGMDGIATYQALRQEPTTQGTPIIFLTALAEGVDVMPRQLPQGRYTILSKLCEPRELLEAIRGALASAPR